MKIIKEKEQVNHPSHYCQHPAGIECIDVIRNYVCDIANALKYLWRAGLKEEMGKDDIEKEIEDLRKALWYIADYSDNHSVGVECADMEMYIHMRTGCTCDQITNGYDKAIAVAIRALLHIGLIHCGGVYAVHHWETALYDAAFFINVRIDKLKSKQL